MMKTAVELIKKGVTKIRKDPWNEYAYLELMSPDGVHYGPWADLYDVMQYEGKEDPVSMFTSICGLDEPVWEPWVDPSMEKVER